MRRWWLVALLLSGCGGGDDPAEAPGARLERAAIATGVIQDPAEVDPAGAYGRDSDRVCVTGSGPQRTIGIYAYYGDDLSCTARGTASFAGGEVTMTLGGDRGCVLTGRYDGDGLAMPGSVPPGCARFCDQPASLAGLGVARLSTSESEARAMRGGDGGTLCP